MDESALGCLLCDDLVNLEDSVLDLLIVGIGESCDVLRLRIVQLTVDLLQLGGGLEVWAGKLLSLDDDMTGLESKVLDLDLSGFDTVDEGSCCVVPADDLERDQIVGGVLVDLIVVLDDVESLDPHPVGGKVLPEVALDSLGSKELEPVLGSPAEGLSLAGDL